MPDELIENLYAETLEKHELQPSSFNLRKIKTAFLKSSPRPLVIVPAVSLAEIEGLPLSPSWRGIGGGGKKMLTLGFKLPRGSYGTIFLKRLMAD